MHGGDIYSNIIEYDFSVNTNPLDCTEIYQAIASVTNEKIGHYPDPLQRSFREAIADIEGVEVANIWGCNGASEAFSAIVNMYRPKRVLLVVPCFAGYRHALAICQECKVETYRLKPEKGYELDEEFARFLETVTEKPDMLIIANPNNPTGRSVADKVMRSVLDICRFHSIKLVVDECFLDMSEGAKTIAGDIDEYDGLYVVKAFTKLFAIPGIRVGYVISQEKNISSLVEFLPEWNMSVPAQEAGGICRDFIRNKCWIETTRKLLAEERSYLSQQLREVGMTVYESDSCFILFYSRDEALKEKLLSKRILIRDCSDYEGLGKGMYRIAVKDHSQNEILVGALKNYR